MSISNDSAGNPVVFMMGCLQNATDTRVVARRHSGRSWDQPVELDAFDGSGTFGSLVSLLDSQGRIHVAYDRRLDDRESYGIIDGQFPDKCFHAWFDGKNWTRSRATTGAGRFYVDPLSLCEMPDATVCLLVQVHPFTSLGGSEKRHTACQVWDGRKWASMRQDLPNQASPPAAATITDYWGNTFTWTAHSDGSCTLNRQGNSGAEAVAILSAPTVIRDRFGRIIVGSCDSSKGEVRLWNGKQWAGPVIYPLQGGLEPAQILCNDGHLLLVHKADSRWVLQQVKLSAPAAATQPQ